MASSTGPTLGDIGEKAFIAQLLPKLEAAPSFVNGFGDDASAIGEENEQRVSFIKIDRAPLPIASIRGWSDYRLWGRLAVTSNCSDILCSGGIPAAFMAALILPSDWLVSDAEEIVLGCVEECGLHGVAFVGGDTKEGNTPEVVGTAIGFGQKSDVVTRAGASPGDAIVLAGRIGGFSGSYLQMIAQLDGRILASKERWNDWLEVINRPSARWAEAGLMRGLRGISAAMDTSDGLYEAASRLTAGLGAVIDLESLPYHANAIEAESVLGVPRINLALGTGDWNILYTMTAKAWDGLKNVGRSDVSLTRIGVVSEDSELLWSGLHGELYRCRPIFNEHFAARFEDEKVLAGELSGVGVLTPIE